MVDAKAPGLVIEKSVANILELPTVLVKDTRERSIGWRNAESYTTFMYGAKTRLAVYSPT